MNGADVARLIIDKYSKGIDTAKIAEEVAKQLNVGFNEALNIVIATVIKNQRMPVGK